MKKLLIAVLLIAICTPAFAMGSRARYNPSVDPSTIQSMWDSLSQITPYCTATFGQYNNNPDAWASCYNCKRADWAKKFNQTKDFETYSNLCGADV